VTISRRISRTFQIVLPLALGLAAALSAGLKVDVLYDAKADFSLYQTYVWETAPRDDSPMATMIDGSIKETTEQELAKKGLRPARDSEEPDLIFTYHAGIEDNLLLEGVRFEIAPHVVWTGADALSATRNYQVGSLIVDMADAKTRKVVWSGVASGKVTPGDKMGDKLGKAIKRVLRRYPPE
jgi:hypothetical protein